MAAESANIQKFITTLSYDNVELIALTWNEVDFTWGYKPVKVI